MEGEQGGGIRLSKRFSDKDGEVDYKTKAGTAWSHSYLNQKPWHPLSYPNQRRKWIAEQTHAHHQRRVEEVTREYAQEQEFFRQTALISKKDREKVEMMKAVSFMYVRPPGYNAESAKAAEISDEMKREDQNNPSQDPPADGSSSAMAQESIPCKNPTGEEKKKHRPKDVFGRSLPTEEDFEILKNAPRLETGAPARVKPFGVEVRNVKCLRCGNHGHQSGDRECPLKDAIMPNEESRLKRDDPLTTILAHADPSGPLKWELKQKPGLSPPHGGFKPDDPNQQIVAEDIFDEYGGFLNRGNIPELLTNFSSKHRKKSKNSSKRKRQSSQTMENEVSSPSDSGENRSKKKEKKHKKKRNHSELSLSGDSEFDSHPKSSRHKPFHSYEEFDSDGHHRNKNSRQKHSYSSRDDLKRHQRSEKSIQKYSYSYSSEDSNPSRHHQSKNRWKKHYCSSEDDSDRHQRSEKSRHKHSHSSEDSDSDTHHRSDRHHRSKRSRQKPSYSSEDSDCDTYHRSDRHHRSRRSRQKHSIFI